MSFSLRLCWTVVVAALMLLAVLGSARAQEPQRQRPRTVAADVANVLDYQSHGATRR